MAYSFKSGESVADAIRRIATDELASAAELLGRASAKERDKAIHEARKSIKKTRALLRLIRKQAGAVYKTEDRRLRDVGRRLSEHRDAQAIIEVFDALKQKSREDWKGRSLLSIRRELVRQKQHRERRPGFAATIRRAAAILATASRRIADWPQPEDRFDAIAPAIERAYRRARRAMAAAGKGSDPAKCHEWRKRVKDHWYHVRLLEGLWSDVMMGYERSLKDLETWLGDHHNLEVLHSKLAAAPDRFGEPADIELCQQSICQFQKELSKNALSLGERIYEQKPRLYRRMMRDLWESWRSQPKSLKQIEKKKREEADSAT